MTGGRDTGLGAVRVIDPSLFTAPYDEALVAALGRAGADAQLVTRPARAGEAELAAQVPVRRRWYRWCDAAPRKLGALGAALKAGEHVVSSLVHLVALRKSGAAHFQWLPFPLADRFLLALWRRMMPVVVTVHDTEPFNNTPTSPVQRWGFAKALRQAHQLIVHTEQGRARLVALGLDEARISVIPHGVGDVFAALIAAGLPIGQALGHLETLARASQGKQHLDIIGSANSAIERCSSSRWAAPMESDFVISCMLRQINSAISYGLPHSWSRVSCSASRIRAFALPYSS